MDYTLAMRLLMLTGVLNLVFLLMLLFSCRCTMVPKALERMTRSRRFHRFYGLHCYLWPLMIISTLVHLALAMYLFVFV